MSKLFPKPSEELGGFRDRIIRTVRTGEASGQSPIIPFHRRDPAKVLGALEGKIKGISFQWDCRARNERQNHSLHSSVALTFVNV